MNRYIDTTFDIECYSKRKLHVQLTFIYNVRPIRRLLKNKHWLKHYVTSLGQRAKFKVFVTLDRNVTRTFNLVCWRNDVTQCLVSNVGPICRLIIRKTSYPLEERLGINVFNPEHMQLKVKQL